MTKQNAQTSCLVYHTNKKDGAGFSFKFEAAISGRKFTYAMQLIQLRQQKTLFSHITQTKDAVNRLS